MRLIAIVIGVLILFCGGIPVLGSVILITGATRAVFSEDFFGPMSDTLTTDLPALLDASLEASSQPGATTDPRTQAWVTALSAVGTHPSEVMASSGVTAWLQGDLSQALHGVTQVLEGELEPEAVVLNLQPLKDALRSQPMRAYLDAVVAQLPPCDAAGLGAWQRAVQERGQEEPLPGCNPGPGMSTAMVERVATDLPAELRIFEAAEGSRIAVTMLRSADKAMWLLFLAPLLIIGLGALIAGRGFKGFLGWSGATILLGGLLSLALALSPPSLRASSWGDWTPAPGSDTWFWTQGPGRQLTNRMADSLAGLAQPLLSNVTIISAVVAGLGLLGLVLAMLVKAPVRPQPMHG